jgi:hypothetical protein
MALTEAQDLHLFREFDEKFLIPFEMMNFSGIAACELAHGFDAFPIGDRHELGFVLAVLAQRLDTERLFDERLDAGFVIDASYSSAQSRGVRPRQIRTMAGCLGVDVLITSSL